MRTRAPGCHERRRTPGRHARSHITSFAAAVTAARRRVMRRRARAMAAPAVLAVIAALTAFVPVASLSGLFAGTAAPAAATTLTSQDTTLTAAASAAADKTALARTGLAVLQASTAARAAAAAALIYTVRAGDTLTGIAVRECDGEARDWTGIYAASRERGWTAWNANDLTAGQRLFLDCAYVPGMLGRAWTPPPPPVVVTAAVSYQAPAASTQHTASSSAVSYGTYSYSGLMALWVSAGGASGTAAHAACIAEHESGGRPWAISPTDDWGLWQIHAGGYAMLNPFANARRAVAMSADGTDWSPWTTAGYC